MGKKNLRNETHHFPLNIRYKMSIVSISRFVLFVSQFAELAGSHYCFVYQRGWISLFGHIFYFYFLTVCLIIKTINLHALEPFHHKYLRKWKVGGCVHRRTPGVTLVQQPDPCCLGEDLSQIWTCTMKVFKQALKNIIQFKKYFCHKSNVSFKCSVYRVLLYCVM